METRSFQTKFLNNGNTLTGLVAVYDSPTTIYQRGKSFTEIIRRGAFAKALASGGNIIATRDHNPANLLGTTKAGTLQLRDTMEGLEFSVDIPDTTTGRDLKVLVNRGDIWGASFTFSVRDGGEKWNKNTRELTDLFLMEVGPVLEPAYPQTKVAVRSRENDRLFFRMRCEEMEKWLIDR